MSTIDEFQKRISKLEVEVAELKQKLVGILAERRSEEVPSSVVVPEEEVAEEAVKEAAIEEPEEKPVGEKPEEETSEEQ